MRKPATGKQQPRAMKRFAALTRVSSREQEREGFSLDVQVDALQQYADRAGGQIVKPYRIAETASRTDERTTFKDLIAYEGERHQARWPAVLQGGPGCPEPVRLRGT